MSQEAFIQLTVERELLIAQGVPEEDLAKPLQPLQVDDDRDQDGTE